MATDHDDLLAAAAGMTDAIADLGQDIQSLRVSSKRNRHLVLLVALSVAVSSVGFVYGLHRTDGAVAVARRASSTAVVNCKAANIGNDIQRKLWDKAFSFPPPSVETPEAKAQREATTAQFKTYIDTAFAPLDCGKGNQ